MGQCRITDSEGNAHSTRGDARKGDHHREERENESWRDVSTGNWEEKWRKLDMPHFARDDAYRWVSRLERYLQLKSIFEEERLQAVMVAMEGKAIKCFQRWESCEPNPTWEGFKTAVIQRFQPSQMQNQYEVLLSLKQTGSIEEFKDLFELYTGPLLCTDPEYLKGIFLNGLNEQVKAESKLNSIKGLA